MTRQELTAVYRQAVADAQTRGDYLALAALQWRLGTLLAAQDNIPTRNVSPDPETVE